MKKRLLSLLLILAVTASALIGCGHEEKAEEPVVTEEKTEESTEDETKVQTLLPNKIEPGVTVSANPEMYDDTDLSEKYAVKMLLLGSEPEDWNLVLNNINDYLKDYNTSLQVDFISWNDYQKGDYLEAMHDNSYDLVFTAPWCYLYSEAAKDTFLTLDTKFVGSYMPLTYKYQVSESWDETTLYSKTVAVPSNRMEINGKMVAIRQDIADQLGIDSLSSWDDYKNYMLQVAENITPETGIYAMAASGENKELWDQYRQQYDTFYALESDYVSMIYQYDGDVPSYDDIAFTYETDMFRDYCADMKELADAGAWGNNALLNVKSDDDSFADLEGASISWNKTVFSYVDKAEENDGVQCSVYFLTPGHLVATEAYSNNDMAIMADSENPERAAMVLDLLKCDTYLNHLVILGIEGKHYTIDDQGEYTELEAGESGYPAGLLSLAWAVKNDDLSEKIADPRKEKILDEMEGCKVACPTVTFVFDDTDVEDQMQVVDQILTECVPQLQLGLSGDADTAVENMLNRCYAAGLQDIKDEFKSQYELWLSTR